MPNRGFREARRGAGLAQAPGLGVRGAFVCMIAVNLCVGAGVALTASRRRGAPVAGVVAALLVASFLLLPGNLLEAQFVKRFGDLVFYKEEVTDTVMVADPFAWAARV